MSLLGRFLPFEGFDQELLLYLREDAHLFVHRSRLFLLDGTGLKDGALRTAEDGKRACLF